MFRDLTLPRFRLRPPRDDGTRQVVCTVRAVDAITSRPIAGATVRLWHETSHTLQTITDRDGIARATLLLPATLRHAYFLPERRVILGPALTIELTALGYAPSACPLAELLGSTDYREGALPLPTLLVMLQPQSRLVPAGM